MHRITKVKKFLISVSKKKLIFSIIGFLVVGGGVYAAFGGGETVQTVKAEIGDVREEVVVTGKVVSASKVSLGFERAGKVVTNNIEVGDKVSEGETLVVLDQSDLLANLNKAKANLNKALVELEATKRQSASSYTQAVNGLVESLNDAYIQADDAVRNDADHFFVNGRDFDARFDPSFNDGGYTFLSAISESTIGHLSDERVRIENLLAKWQREEESLSQTPTKADFDNMFAISRDNLRIIQGFLDEIAAAINTISTDNFSYKTTISGYKTTISSARNKVVTALTSLSNAKTTYNNAPYLDSAVGVYDDVIAEEARIQGLREDVAAIQADLTKTVLTAPISGVVTQADAKRGEMITAGKTLVSILSEEALRVESNVSETSIGRVETGNPVTITFDAFPQETYTGKVVYVDPGEVLIDDVPTYKVTVAFDTQVPERVRSGLTANLRILTASRIGVIKIPAYALEKEKGEYMVTILGQKAPEKRLVTVGLRGEDGSVEILEGLGAGEEVVVSHPAK